MFNKRKILKSVVAVTLVVGTLASVTVNHIKSKASDDKRIEISSMEDWNKVDCSDLYGINFSQLDIDWDSLENEIDDEILEEIDEIFEENLKVRVEQKTVTSTFAKYYSQLENMTEEEYNEVFNSAKYKIEYRDVYKTYNTRGDILGEVKSLLDVLLNANDLTEDIGPNLTTVLVKLLQVVECKPILITAVVAYIAAKLPGFITRQLREFVGEDWKTKLIEAISLSKGNAEVFKNTLKKVMPENVASLLVDFLTFGRFKDKDGETSAPTATPTVVPTTAPSETSNPSEKPQEPTDAPSSTADATGNV